ncbi:MAM and LDL-receptor class A domain-containing protein 1-like [Penaeus japonicus]|uniref:MAM and LDL-receptor class A domain-containing protein 1-like n=1 Tax=Penaeus japonicus TaxID=27405 RepID=UPI001C714DD5|nr:MAM and LDL-receptor class A domain-containing protein 1-like [Penaeus japonicus]
MSDSSGKFKRKMTFLFLFAIAFGATPVYAQADCSFNATGTLSSVCSLLDNSDAFAVASWRVGTGTESFWSGGPAVDNGNDPAGGYGFTTTHDMIYTDQPHKKAWLVTQPNPQTGALGKCLEFAYATYGLGIDEFEVLLLTYLTEDANDALQNDSIPVTFQRTNLMKHKGSTRGQWQPAKVTFSAKTDFSVAFEAVPNMRFARYTGYVAVDDITFKDGPCENECIFDANFCELTNEPNNDDFDWSLGRGSDKINTGPTRDQSSFITNLITGGGYAYIDSGYPRTDGEIAQLVSPVLGPTDSPMCLKFWLNMYGSGVGMLRVVYSPTTNTDNIRELWKQGGSSLGPDEWYPCQVTVSSPESFNLIFEASVGSQGAGDIAIDTISYSMGACPSQPAFSSSTWGDCNFMENTCGWQVPYFPDEVCSMLSRVSESSENPPGHTENVFNIRDSYIQFDLNCYQQQPRHTVSLTFPEASITSETCLSFWVYMFTRVHSLSKIGALSVVLITSSGNETLWRLENEQHSSWVHAQVTIPPVGQASVAFVGTKASSLIGMIGVDDITVFNSACEVLPEQARVGVADCSFDNGLCAWTVQNEDPLATRPSENWRHATRDVGSVAGLLDHTFGADGGGYVYLDVFNTDVVSWLRSPNNLEKNATYCLSFSFAALFPDSRAELTVVKDLLSTKERVWQVLGDAVRFEENKWYKGQVELEAVEDGFTLYFEGKVGRGGWAIDDVTLSKTSSSCKMTPDFALQTP